MESLLVDKSWLDGEIARLNFGPDFYISVVDTKKVEDRFEIDFVKEGCGGSTNFLSDTTDDLHFRLAGMTGWILADKDNLLSDDPSAAYLRWEDHTTEKWLDQNRWSIFQK